MTKQSPIRIVTVRGKSNGPHLLITAGVHGDEFTPMAAVRKLSCIIIENCIQRGVVTLAPIVNEAAFNNGHRTAEDALDLARVCPGRSDGSITERTAFALSDLIRKADYYIDLHTGSATNAVHPMVGYTLHPNAGVLDEQRRIARAFNLPILWGTSATLDGRSLSVARDAGVPAIYAEYLGSGVCDPRGVQAYMAGCLNVMGELEMIDHAAPEPAVSCVVEDDRPNSGHMQIQNPSPISGFFEPAVELGQEIRAGDPIGAVIDLDDNRSIDVLSTQDGIVLVLQTFSRIRQGESVGVILETKQHASDEPNPHAAF